MSLGHLCFSAPLPKAPYLVVVNSWVSIISYVYQLGLKWLGTRKSDRLPWESPFDLMGYLSTSAPKG